MKSNKKNVVYVIQNILPSYILIKLNYLYPLLIAFNKIMTGEIGATVTVQTEIVGFNY